MPVDIVITEGCTVRHSELRFETARSSGPGGQHVNKTETKVTLVFDVDASTSLSEEQRDLLRRRLASRLSKDGELRLSSQRSRSQRANREDVVERFADLLRTTLMPVPERKATRVPATAKRQRREEKQKTAAKKKGRQRVEWE